MSIKKSKKTEKTAKKSKRMRTAFLRVSAINHTESGKVVYTRDDILDTTDRWQKTKSFSYYIIEHINDDGTNLHWHIVIEFSDNSTCEFNTLKNKFPYGHIDTCRTGVHNCVRYLVHADNPEKKQYSWDDIITNAPNKLELYKIPVKFKIDAKAKIIAEKIIAGEIKEFEINKIEHEIFLNRYSSIKRAFEYRRHIQLTDPERQVDVIVLQGKPRTGKSTFCRAWAEKYDKSICFSSTGRDYFGEYLGQDIYVFDDFCSENIKINDFKRVIDPHLNAAVESRYHNKQFIGDTIFIATNQPITSWYPHADKTDRQAIFERINYVLIFDDKPSSDGIVSYTVNKFDDMELKPIDNPNRTLDLKKYIDITADKTKRDDFLSKLDEI